MLVANSIGHHRSSVAVYHLCLDSVEGDLPRCRSITWFPEKPDGPAARAYVPLGYSKSEPHAG